MRFYVFCNSGALNVIRLVFERAKDVLHTHSNDCITPFGEK